jgi:hypothetical protein
MTCIRVPGGSPRAAEAISEIAERSSNMAAFVENFRGRFGSVPETIDPEEAKRLYEDGKGPYIATSVDFK